MINCAEGFVTLLIRVPARRRRGPWRCAALSSRSSPANSRSWGLTVGSNMLLKSIHPFTGPHAHSLISLSVTAVCPSQLCVCPSQSCVRQSRVRHSGVSVTAVCPSQLCVRHSCVSVTAVCLSQLCVRHSCVSVTAVCPSQRCVCHSCVSVTAVCPSQLCVRHSGVSLKLSPACPENDNSLESIL